VSAFVGLWGLDGRPADPAVLEAMSAALRHRGPDGAGRALAGSFGVACQHLWVTPEEVGELQPLTGPEGLLLAFDGRLDNRAELLPRLRVSRSASDAACVLAAYAAWGEVALERLAGDFALALYDPARHRLLLARDPIGVRPLYYVATARLFAFASEIKALLQHPDVRAEPDEDGVADYLLLGRRPVDRLAGTCFAGVRALPPAHVMTVTPDGAGSARRYWDFPRDTRLPCASFGEYAEAFHERFAEAVRRRTRSAYPVAVSLSGGLDSSSIFCQAEVLRREADLCPALLAFSYVGPEGSMSDERAYLAEIECAYGVRVERQEPAPLAGMIGDAPLQAWHSETPLLDSLWPITRRLQAAAGAAGARRLLTGHWGDQMLYSTAYLGDLLRRGAWRTFARHLAALPEWFSPEEARHLRRQAAAEAVRRSAPAALLPAFKWLRRRLTRLDRRKAWLADGFRRRALRDALRPAVLGRRFRSAHARSLYLEACGQYSVHCMEWDNKVTGLHGLDHAFPFLDRDLVQFLLATPGQIQNWRGVPRALLREGMAGTLPEAIRQRRWKADFTEPVNGGAAGDLAGARRLFANGSRAVALGYVDASRVSGALDRIAAGLDGPDCLAGWELADLIGLESWLGVFFEQPPMGVTT
jgi:asparagine synthase (glutamine-hydrolysing)